MKKHFSFSNQRGFFLPYILFIIALVFIIVSANIKIYQNEIHTMEHLTEQIHIESLLQMGYMKYKDQMKDVEEFPQKVLFDFPSGEVNVFYISHEKNIVSVRYHIKTDKNNSFSIKGTIKLPNNK